MRRTRCAARATQHATVSARHSTQGTAALCGGCAARAMSASRRCMRLRFLLYSLGALVCIARFISFTWDLPPESPRTFSPTPSFNMPCNLPLVPYDPTSFDETAPIPGYPYWNPQDGPPLLDSYRCMAALSDHANASQILHSAHLCHLGYSLWYVQRRLIASDTRQYEQLRTLWWFAAQLGRTVILPTVQGKNETASRALIESVWSLSVRPVTTRQRPNSV